jgi:hypothetical protein
VSDQALEQQRELWERWKRGTRASRLAAFPHDSERGPHDVGWSIHESSSCPPCGGTGRSVRIAAALDATDGCRLLPRTRALVIPGPCTACGGTGRQWRRAR